MHLIGKNSFPALLLLLLLSIEARGQDLEKIGKGKDPVKVTGSFSATGTAYTASGIEARRDPFYWMLNSSINFDIYGVYIPFSATVSQQQKSFTQPFNMYGLSPKYKSVTAHLGYRSMEFSTFTLSGNIFLGAGVEVAPDSSKFKVAAMYGRFARAVAVQETEGVISGDPAFERWGYGSKITYGTLKRSVDLIFFKARDKASSIPTAVADSFDLTPAENFVIGLTTRQAINKRLTFDLEYALSAYTNNIHLQETQLESYRYANNLGFLFSPNVSSHFNKAILGNLTYNANKYQLRFSYRRIDPEYKTMGSTFLNNDLEDITANVGWRMLKNKINMSLGGGLQRNNLDNDLASGNKRLIGSFNCTWMVNKKLNLNAMFSNFTSNTKFNTERITPNQFGLNQNLDSLNFNQVTTTAGGGFNYNTGTEKVKHQLFSNGNYQQANDSHKNSSSFMNVYGGWQLSYVPKDLVLTASLNMNSSKMRETDNTAIGPSLALSRQFLKKTFRTTLSLTRQNTWTGGEESGNNTMVRIANSYKKGKHHSVSMDVSYVTRNMKTGTLSSFSETRGSLVYNYTF